MNNEKATILFVDDEARILRSLKALFKSQYQVHTTTDGYEALKILKNNTVHVIVSDQRMPIMTGVELLLQAKEISPNTIRLLLTGYSDLDAIINSVNEGEIFRYINKPWDNNEIQSTVSKASTIGLNLIKVPTTPEPQTSTKPQIGILVIDDDVNTYNVVQKVVEQECGSKCLVKWGTTRELAFDMLSQEEITIVISEIKIAGEDMALSFKLMKQHHPDIVTIVLTSFKDAQTLINLINQGQIYRFLSKPIRNQILEVSIKAALQHCEVTQQRPELLARHSVEEIKEQIDTKVSSRIMGFLRKRKKKRQ